MKKIIFLILTTVTIFSTNSMAKPTGEFEVESVLENCHQRFEDMGREVLIMLKEDANKKCGQHYSYRKSDVVLSSHHRCWLTAKATFKCDEL